MVISESFDHSTLLPVAPDTTTRFRALDLPAPEVVRHGDLELLHLPAQTLRALARTAIDDISHLLRTSHLQQLRRIVDDPESSANDRYVATDLLHNAVIASGRVLPMCQDTGTAIVTGKRGRRVFTDGDDERQLAHGIADAYRELNLRYSQLAPLSMFDETNTGTNLPAQIEIAAAGDDTYELLFMAKGGGSANKSFLFQETKAVLNPTSLRTFLREKIAALGTSACPPYHLAVVVGGTSAEFALKTAKLASAHALDGLPTCGSPSGHGFRDLEWEHEILSMTEELGIGAQFGGKYFCHDVRVVRLPRHGGSCPIALAVSCSADRQATAKITRDGIFLEQLETDPAQFLPEVTESDLGAEVIEVDLDGGIDHIRTQLHGVAVGTRLSLTGTLIVARDLVHAALKQRLDAGDPLPQYLIDHPVYYAGPAKTPTGAVSGSFGPTTAGRMDSYVEQFQAAGGSLIMLAKGNRSAAVARSCATHGGFYLGTIGGPAARIAAECITDVAVLDYAELGMEAVWRIQVRDFPAFVVVDDTGRDFFARDDSGVLVNLGPTVRTT
ncbi:FumA C-terminus/TtdB family hydratase beta subunit [Williamsia sp. CHRR-6]|uniref:FumA C-terminus/TtdB family hydratase beta subunit n=1 Tax=Williamsia sp. CHRR-6 TaxID=2835871 RepID=UPI001BD9D566|nr:FumA C-terminus/TtdB family hydratase beta subunit [Williamsia sp. CHRR-6]MBT0567791.1 fumarate hydratase [Williamsia sp. CHRR-6]